jgi:pimeloyl-ACP methyl ester carboxylesterase
LTTEFSVERFEARDGVQLAVHVGGSGPPVVCVPGGPGRASEYLEDFGGLSESHTLLRVDLRGTGRSELPEERESLQFPRLADDIEDLRVARGLETIDIVAHSAGCFVSLVYAMRYPSRLSRLVLVTPSGRGFGDVEDDVAQVRASRSDEPWYPEAAEIEAELALMPAHRRARMDRGLRVFGYARWDERAQAHAAATDTQMSLRATAGFSADDFLEHGRRLREALQEVTAQVLIIVGDLDGITGVRAGRLVADPLPDATVQELSGTAHYPWVDAPETFRAAIVSFLAGARPAAHPS